MSDGPVVVTFLPSATLGNFHALSPLKRASIQASASAPPCFMDPLLVRSVNRLVFKIVATDTELFGNIVGIGRQHRDVGTLYSRVGAKIPNSPGSFFCAILGKRERPAWRQIDLWQSL